MNDAGAAVSRPTPTPPPVVPAVHKQQQQQQPLKHSQNSNSFRSSHLQASSASSPSSHPQKNGQSHPLTKSHNSHTSRNNRSLEPKSTFARPRPLPILETPSLTVIPPAGLGHRIRSEKKHLTSGPVVSGNRKERQSRDRHLQAVPHPHSLPARPLEGRLSRSPSRKSDAGFTNSTQDDAESVKADSEAETIINSGPEEDQSHDQAEVYIKHENGDPSHTNFLGNGNGNGKYAGGTANGGPAETKDDRPSRVVTQSSRLTPSAPRKRKQPNDNASMSSNDVHHEQLSLPSHPQPPVSSVSSRSSTPSGTSSLRKVSQNSLLNTQQSSTTSKVSYPSSANTAEPEQELAAKSRALGEGINNRGNHDRVREEHREFDNRSEKSTRSIRSDTPQARRPQPQRSHRRAESAYSRSPQPPRSLSPKRRGHTRSSSSATLGGAKSRAGTVAASSRRRYSIDDRDSRSPSVPASSYPARSRRSRLNDGYSASPARSMPKRRRDQNGRTPLARACAAQEFEAAKAYHAEVPEDLNVPDNAGNTPLQIASLEGCADIVQFLISCGCDIETKNIDKDTPLIDAVENGHLEVVKMLLDAGANPRIGNAQGDEPYDLVPSDSEHFEEIRKIIAEAKEKSRRRKSVDRGRSQHGDSSQSGSHETRGSSPLPAKRHDRSPPLAGIRTRKSVRSETTRNDLLWTRPTLETLRDFAAKGDMEGTATILNVLQKADTESLIAAAKGGHDEVLGLLLGMGDPNPDPEPVRTHRDGINTPMLAAIGRGNDKVIRLLLDQKGFNPTRRLYKGFTYYELADQRRGDQWETEYELLKNAYDNYTSEKNDKERSPSKKAKDKEKKNQSDEYSHHEKKRPRREASAADESDAGRVKRRKELKKPATEDSDEETSRAESKPSQVRHVADANRERERDSTSEEPPVVRRRRLFPGRPPPGHSRRIDGHASSESTSSGNERQSPREESPAKSSSSAARNGSHPPAKDSHEPEGAAKKRRTEGHAHDKPSGSPSSSVARPPSPTHKDELPVAKSLAGRTASKNPAQSRSRTTPGHQSSKSSLNQTQKANVTSDSQRSPVSDSQRTSELTKVQSADRKTASPTLSANPSSHPAKKLPKSDLTSVPKDGRASPSSNARNETPATVAENDKMDVDDTEDTTKKDDATRSTATDVEPKPVNEKEDSANPTTEETRLRAEQAAEEERMSLEKKARELREAAEAAERAAQDAFRIAREREEQRVKENELRQARIEEEQRRVSAERERARMEIMRREQEEAERLRRESLPNMLRVAAEYIGTNDPRAKSHAFLRHFVPIYYTTTKAIDPSCDPSVADVQWIPNYFVAPLLGTNDLSLSNYPSWKRREATPTQRMCMWCVSLRCMIKKGDENPLTLTTQGTYARCRPTKDAFLAMKDLFWVRKSDFEEIVPHIPCLSGLRIRYDLMGIAPEPEASTRKEDGSFPDPRTVTSL